MSYLFYGINSAIKYAMDGYSKELSDFLAKKPHLVNQKNKNGNTILHIACYKGDSKMALMLLLRGAKLDATDSLGFTPLMVAIECNHDDLAVFLIDRGADITIGNQTLCMPLHVAALMGTKKVVIPLLQRGAEINATETNGCTPLLLAVSSGHDEVAMILIEKGADLSVRDMQNKLPYDIAKEGGLTAVVAAIKIRQEFQDQARSRSSSASVKPYDAISEKYEKSLEERLKSRKPIVPSVPHAPDDVIAVERTYSLPALVHTMSPPCDASVVSTGLVSKSSKMAKKKRKERRQSVSGMSTLDATAQIEAVFQAMKESGGNKEEAAQLIVDFYNQNPPKSKRKSSRKEEKIDDFSVGISVISEGTNLSKADHRKRRSSNKDLFSPMHRLDDDERSVRSSSTIGSKMQGKKTHSSSSIRKSTGIDDDVSYRSGSRGRRTHHDPNLPEEEVLVIRKSGGSVSSKREQRRERHEETLMDDVDSDGEPALPPVLFCFWMKPPAASSKGRNVPYSGSSSSTRQGDAPAAATKEKKGGCSVM